jgi:hypothetical protein
MELDKSETYILYFIVSNLMFVYNLYWKFRFNDILVCVVQRHMWVI